VFNVLIELALIKVGVFDVPEGMLGFCASFAVAWIGALVADLVVNKPLGLGTVLALSAFVGAFGHGTL